MGKQRANKGKPYWERKDDRREKKRTQRRKDQRSAKQQRQGRS